MTTQRFRGAPSIWWFRTQAIKSFTVEGDRVRLQKSGDHVSLELADVTIRTEAQWLGLFTKVTLHTPRDSYAIEGLRRNPADTLVGAVDEAHRRRERRAFL